MSATTLPDLNLLPAEALKASGAWRSMSRLLCARERDRASEAADRQAAAHAVRAQVGEAGAADRAAGTAAGRAASETSGERAARAESPCRPGISLSFAYCKTGAASVARTSAAPNAEARTEGNGLSGLRRRVAQAGRRCLGDAGVRAGAASR